MKREQFITVDSNNLAEALGIKEERKEELTKKVFKGVLTGKVSKLIEEIWNDDEIENNECAFVLFTLNKII